MMTQSTGTIAGTRCVILEGDSMTDWHLAPQRASGARQSDSNAPSTETWRGHGGKASWIAALTQGWSEGRQRIEGAIQDVNLRGEAQRPRRKRTRGDNGDSLDITRVYCGDLDHAWERTSRGGHRTGRARIATVVVNITISAAQAPDDLFWRGAATVRAVDALEATGTRCRVIVAFQTMSAHAGVPCTISLAVAKDHNDPLDLDRLAHAVSHSCSLRYAAFRSYEHAKDVGALSGGYGYPQYAPLSTLKGSRLMDAAEQIIEVDPSITSQYTAQRWLAENEVLRAVEVAS